MSTDNTGLCGLLLPGPNVFALALSIYDFHQSSVDRSLWKTKQTLEEFLLLDPKEAWIAGATARYVFDTKTLFKILQKCLPAMMTSNLLQWRSPARIWMVKKFSEIVLRDYGRLSG